MSPNGPACAQQATAAQRADARPANDCCPAACALAALLSAGRSLPSYGVKTCNYLRFKPKNVKTCMLCMAPAAFCWLTLRRAPPQVSAWTRRATDSSKAPLGRAGPPTVARRISACRVQPGSPARSGLNFCCILAALWSLVLQNGRQGAWRRGLASVLQHKFLASVRSATQVCLERGAQSPEPGAQSPEPGAWGSPDNGAGHAGVEPVGHRQVECWGGGTRPARRRETRRATARDTSGGGSKARRTAARGRRGDGMRHPEWLRPCIVARPVASCRRLR